MCIPEGFRKAHHYKPVLALPGVSPSVGTGRTSGLSRQKEGSFVPGRGYHSELNRTLVWPVGPFCPLQGEGRWYWGHVAGGSVGCKLESLWEIPCGQ